MTIRAKMLCHWVEKHADSETVHLHAVYSSDPANPNHSWSAATPGGNLSMNISNPAAMGEFIQGKEYFIDFTPAA